MSSKPSERLPRLRTTLGLRLAAWHAGLFLALSVGVLALAYLALDASLRAGERAVVSSELQELAAAYERGGIDGLRDEAASQKLLPEGAGFVRIQPAAGPTATLLSPGSREAFDLGRLPHPDKPGVREWSRAPASGDEDALEVASLRLTDGSVLQAGMSTEASEAFLERFRGIVLAVLLPTAAFAVLGGVLFTRRALAPLRALIETIRAIEAGSLDSRVRTGGSGDELDELGVLFNRMLDKIASLVAGMRGAVDDVAHDLRTPLTRLRGGAEMALRSSASPETLREALAECVEESDEILVMLEGLLDVAEAEAGTMRLRIEDVDLGRLASETAELYSLAAEEKGLRLDVAAAAAPLSGDRARLRRAIANLVDNAVKYTPRGGTVSICAAREGDAAVLRVRDDGPGIPASDLPRVWDRLFRGDRSRSERGLGLGLSLVKAIVEAHGGTANVESRPGAGTVFTLLLPDRGMTRM